MFVLIQTVLMQAYTDGACRGNPGPGGAGVVLLENDELIEEWGEYLGESCTNNIAEYSAIISAIEKVCTTRPDCRNVTIYSDSKLAIEQICERWKVNKAHLRELRDKVKVLMKEGNISVDFVWVKGHDGNPMNERADKLAVEASIKKV